MLKKIRFTLLLPVFAVMTQSMSSEKTISVKANLPHNAPEVIKGKNGIIVSTSDIENTISSFKRAIDITSSEEKELHYNFTLSFVSDNKKQDIYDVLKNNPLSFSGTFSISTGTQEIYTIRIEKGVMQKSAKKVYNAVPAPVYDPNVNCGVGTVHDCVSYKIEEMK